MKTAKAIFKFTTQLWVILCTISITLKKAERNGNSKEFSPIFSDWCDFFG